jgi:hypothetical protein
MTVLLLSLTAALVSQTIAGVVPFVPFEMTVPSGFTTLRTSGNSTLFEAVLPANATVQQYTWAPLALRLVGSRKQIGHDYAALMHREAAFTLDTFLTTLFPTSPTDRALLLAFVDFCWNELLEKNTDAAYLDELAGMDSFKAPAGVTPTSLVAKRFYTLANMPADPVNIINMLEEDLERGLPTWLKTVINDVVRVLEKAIFHSCDAYAVWGPRTTHGQLYSSRNLDYNSDTGINKYKLVTFYQIDNQVPYATIGFSFGMGALAGINMAGVTVSEMNLDNSLVTFQGLAFPLRLRKVLESSTSLQRAMTVWNATQNTNSFNFLIASAADSAAFALETVRGFTAVFPANSPIERAATVDCTGNSDQAQACHKWTTQKGVVRIGSPLPNAVWRSNHGVSPGVMPTQEPLFNNTVFRYNLQHDLIDELAQANELIDDTQAVGIVASLGIKGDNYFSCDQLAGDNVMSIAYAPAVGGGHFWVAFESGAGKTWRPASCSPYIRFDLGQFLH